MLLIQTRIDFPFSADERTKRRVKRRLIADGSKLTIIERLDREICVRVCVITDNTG